jgi:hypothetical protein
MRKPRFLYHGSSRRAALLTPHQADDWRFEIGRRLGVYATSERDVALAFALGGVADETGTCHREMRRKGERARVEMVFVRGHPNYGGKGYLYKLSSKGFRHVGGTQWVRDCAVKPMATLEISVDDYSHLFRYATEQERMVIERELKQRQRNRRRQRCEGAQKP